MAVTFTRPVDTVPELYVGASDQGGDGGWLGYVLPGAPLGRTSFTLAEAFAAFEGSFLFGSRAPTLTPAGAAALVQNVKSVAGGSRRCLWVSEPDQVSLRRGFGFVARAGIMTLGMQAKLGANLLLDLVNGSRIAVEGDAMVLSAGHGGAPPVTWSGPAALTGGEASATAIPCAGPKRGCVVFAQSIDRSALHDCLGWGFQMVVDDSRSPSGYQLGWYPLAGSAGDRVPMAVSVDPTDVFNASAVDRTAFAFTTPSTVLTSGYRTASGWPVTLEPVVAPGSGQEPARLWPHASPEDSTRERDLVACPVGDFVLRPSEPAGATTDPALLCGLAGTETIAFASGDTMRFTARQPAFALGYPYPDASPTLPPVDPLAPKLGPDFLTSWTSLVTSGGDGGHYSAQPKGASLYAKPASHDAGVLLFTEPGTTLPKKTALPILPYALVREEVGFTFRLDQYVDVETKVVAAERRARISDSAGLSAGPRAPVAGAEGNGAGTQPATTPAGLVVQVDQPTGRYTEIDLAQAVDRTPPVVMKLTEPTGPVQGAFQTSQLFLVVANAGALGTLVGWPPTAPAGPAFYNAMTIGDWALLADVGRHRGYGDYANVLIVKGRQGKLADLVAKPDLWTESSLAIPTTGDRSSITADGTDGAGDGASAAGAGPDASQLPALSRWLQDYIADAAAQSSDYFDAFNALVQDESWTGVLVLKADIAAVPDDLVGMLGGIDRSRFNAHHFGFTITKVDPVKVAMDGNSATFGLIYYVDPAFEPDRSPPRPVPPAEKPWDFRVLTLKALFANAAVQRFESYAQLTVQELFGQAVDHMGADGANPYDALILTGSLHRQGGMTSYGLEAAGDSTFFFDGGVFNKVEVVQAELTTTGQVPVSGGTRVSARFDLDGFLDFETLEDDGEPFDLFSFGSVDGKALRQGLSFSGLAITMVFDEPTDPSTPTGTPVYAFDASKVSFDPARSTPRAGSLFQSLALKVDSLVVGAAQSTPGDLGYLDVATPLRLPGVRGDWYGLRLQASFGSPGALAGKVGLTSYLMVAWSPPAANGGSTRLGLGLLPPNAGDSGNLLDLEGVMKLAVGPISLTSVPDAQGDPTFMLVMSEIALKFLGMLKLPPSGATAFYVFGDTTGERGPLGWFALYKGPDPPKPGLMVEAEPR